MHFGSKDALIVVDMQYDFLPGGPLAVPDGDALVPKIASFLTAVKRIGCVIFTQDWHPPEHRSFAASYENAAEFSVVRRFGEDQVLWPVHCVAGTPGSRIHSDIPLTKAAMILRKGSDPNVDSYSAFQENMGPNGMRETTGLGAFLNARGIQNVYSCGLAADYCVKWTAIDAAEAGFHSVILRDLTRAVYADTPEKRAKVLRDQEAADLFLNHHVYCTDSFES